MKDPMVRYYMFYFTVSINGIIFSPIFYTILLIDVVHWIPTLSFVIKTVSNNTWNLLFVGLLMAIIIYIFALIGNFYIWDLLVIDGVYWWNDELPGENMCMDMWDCFVWMTHYGL